jgi:pantoate--beta-alanine ligase
MTRTATAVLLRTADELRAWRDASDAALGFVPTMGALHGGHAALLRRARAENPRVLASVFVNAAQFGRAADLAAYPRTLEADLALCAAQGADAVYAPDERDVYPADFGTWVEPGPAAAAFEGAARPGHFRGVLTVVLKLLQRARPQRAYFGEKDAQQLFLVRRMAADFDLATAIVGCPTVREADGLAMSSRNRRLTSAQRADALCLHRALEAARAAFAAGGRDPRALAAMMKEILARAAAGGAVRPDYAEIVDDADFAPARAAAPGAWRAIVAAEVHGVRLLDNQPLGAV